MKKLSKKILYIGNYSFVNLNAAGKRVYYNCKILNELGYETVSINLTKDIKEGIREEKVNNNMKVYEFPYPKNSLYWIKYKEIYSLVKRVISEEDIECIIFYGSPAISILLYKILKLCRRKNIKVYSDCADWLNNHSNNIIFNIFKWIDYNYQKRIINKKVDGIILISSYLKDYYKKVKKVIIPPLNELNCLEPVVNSKEQKTLSYAGIPFRLKQKEIVAKQMKDRLDLVIDILYEVYKKNKNFVFNIYGITKFEYLYAIPRHDKILKEMNNIKFYGLLKYEEIQSKISCSDFTILFRDKTRETMAGFSTKIAESLSLFTPVITNNTSDINKYIRNGENGFILDINDKVQCVNEIIKILNINNEEITKMKNSCKNNQQFYYKNYINEMKMFIKEVSMKKKKKVMLVFSEGGENGGPFVSHKRIMESDLKDNYNFVKLIIPKGRLKVFNIKLFLNLVKQIKKEKPDVIQCNGLQLQGYHCMLAAFFCRIPNRLVAIHGSSLESTSFSKFKLFVMNILEQITLFLSTGYYGVSDYTSGWKRIQKFKSKSFGTIYNLPPIFDISKMKKGMIRKEIGVTNKDIIVVSTARITAEKGFDVLKEVIKNNKNDNVRFLIVGDGEYLNVLRKDLKKYIKSKKVFLLGYRSDILNILLDSDIFMLLTHHENLSMSLLEASKLRIPIITTKVGGNPEIVNDGINGFLVKNYDVKSPCEALDKIISNGIDLKDNNVFEKKFDRNLILDKLSLMYNYDVKKDKNVKDYLSKSYNKGGE